MQHCIILLLSLKMKSQMAFAFAIVCIHMHACIMHYALFNLCVALCMSQLITNICIIALVDNEMQQGAMSICFGMHAFCIMH
jgi:hypothetical protein